MELGHIDIHVEVSLLSCYLTQPQKGYLDKAPHTISYLKHCYHSKIVFDSNSVVLNDSQFNKSD